MLISLSIGSGALALWSALNPGYYYLGRAALFTIIGAGAIYMTLGGRFGRYRLAAALVYVTLVSTAAIAMEFIASPPDQVESINVLYLPIAVLSGIASVLTAVTAKLGRQVGV